MTNEKKSQRQKKPYSGILSPAMRAYILSDKKQSYNKSEYNKRLVEYTKISLKEDLPLLLEKLDEELQSKIFNTENLKPFFKALLTVKYRESMTEKEIEKRRQRLLKLSYELITELVNNLVSWHPKVGKLLCGKFLSGYEQS